MSERIAKRISASRLFPQFGREFLAELTHLGRDDVRAVRLARVVAEIIPMVVLGGVEGFGRAHFGDNRRGPDLLGVQLANGLFRRKGVYQPMIKNFSPPAVVGRMTR